jgi:hypothetical protein
MTNVRTVAAVLLAAALVGACPGLMQSAAAQSTASVGTPREAVLESDRWRAAQQRLDGWLAVQQLYSADEVAAMRAEMEASIARKSAPELEAYLGDLESRLDVLTSPAAGEARVWLSQFLARQAMYTEEQLRARRPDVWNMSAEQIRDELTRFQQRRTATQQSQAALSRGRQLQRQSIQTQRSARTNAQAESLAAARSRAAAEANRRVTQPAVSPYSPFGSLPGYSPPPPRHLSPLEVVGPWGGRFQWELFDPFY